jgi:hypothetical protein
MSLMIISFVVNCELPLRCAHLERVTHHRGVGIVIVIIHPYAFVPTPIISTGNHSPQPVHYKLNSAPICDVS